MLDRYKENLRKAVNNVQALIEVAEANRLTNEQFYLDFLDKLNELSVSS